MRWYPEELGYIYKQRYVLGDPSFASCHLWGHRWKHI